MTRALALPLILGCVAACSWSVPADPGENARFRRGTRDAESGTTWPSGPADEGARTVYVTKCGQCHEPFAPSHATAAQWPHYVRKYGPRAGLFGAERERVLEWLQSQSR